MANLGLHCLNLLTTLSIVFLTWWQGVAIALSYAVGLVKSPIARSLYFKSTVQDFIIYIEVIVSNCIFLTATL